MSVIIYYIYLYHKQKQNIMKKQITKGQVIARLVKCGHNEENATRYTNEHFDYAVKYYSTVNKIADVIMSL